MQETETIDFLRQLGDVDEGDWFIQTFDDRKEGNRAALSERRITGTAALKKILPGLHYLNDNHDAGVYFCVNALKVGARRTSDNVEAVTAFFLDLDGAPLQPILDWALQPNIVVQTSVDRWHCYWILDNYYPEALRLFKQIQRWLADKFSGDRSITDLCRVMRLPGFFNMKGVPYLVNFKCIRQQPYKLQEIVDAYNFSKADQCAGALGGAQPNINGGLAAVVLPDGITLDDLALDKGRGGQKNMQADLTFSADRLRGALLSIPADDYDVWLRVGMALQGAAVREDAEMSMDEAYEWWLSWSGTSDKFDESGVEEKWQGLNARGETGLGTVFELAQQQGWNGRPKSTWSAEEGLELFKKLHGIK